MFWHILQIHELWHTFVSVEFFPYKLTNAPHFFINRLWHTVLVERVGLEPTASTLSEWLSHHWHISQYNDFKVSQPHIAFPYGSICSTKRIFKVNTQPHILNAHFYTTAAGTFAHPVSGVYLLCQFYIPLCHKATYGAVSPHNETFGVSVVV